MTNRGGGSCSVNNYLVVGTLISISRGVIGAVLAINMWQAVHNMCGGTAELML